MEKPGSGPTGTPWPDDCLGRMQSGEPLSAVTTHRGNTAARTLIPTSTAQLLLWQWVLGGGTQGPWGSETRKPASPCSWVGSFSGQHQGSPPCWPWPLALLGDSWGLVNRAYSGNSFPSRLLSSGGRRVVSKCGPLQLMDGAEQTLAARLLPSHVCKTFGMLLEKCYFKRSLKFDNKSRKATFQCRKLVLSGWWSP